MTWHVDLKNGMYFLSRDELDDFFFFATDNLQFLSLGPVSFPFPLVFFLLLPSFLSFLKKRFKFVTYFVSILLTAREASLNKSYFSLMSQVLLTSMKSKVI